MAFFSMGGDPNGPYPLPGMILEVGDSQRILGGLLFGPAEQIQP